MENNLSFPLADLAKAINTEHQLCIGAIREGLDHAIKAGEYLTRAKEQCQHGQWLSWLAENVTFSERTAQNYMRVYDRRAELEAKAQQVADLTYRDAVLLLAEPKPPEEPGQLERKLGQLLNMTEALKEIRDKNYYRSTHTTFEDYCRDKLKIENVNELLEVFEYTFSSPIETAKLQAIITLKNYGVKLTSVGAEFPRELSRDECLEVTKQLLLLERLADKDGDK